MLFPTVWGKKSGSRQESRGCKDLLHHYWVLDCSYRTELSYRQLGNLLLRRFRVLCSNAVRSMFAFWWNQEVSYGCLSWCVGLCSRRRDLTLPALTYHALCGYQQSTSCMFANIETHCSHADFHTRTHRSVTVIINLPHLPYCINYR